MNKDYMELCFPALSENESFGRAVVAAFAARKNPTVDMLSDIKTAVSEAITNAIVHGYGGQDGVIRLKAWLDGDTLHISVSDDGVGIADVGKAMEPFFTTCPEGERSGIGFTMMQSFMDGVSVQSAPGQGTSVLMWKDIN